MPIAPARDKLDLVIERRRETPAGRPTPLPADYLRLVNETFTETFAGPLEALRRNKRASRFVASGALYPDEVLLSVSLVPEGRLAATTVHASCDFDLGADASLAEALLARCVDAIGSLFAEILSPAFLRHPPSAAHEIPAAPLRWTAAVVEGRPVYLRVDASNPDLENAADRWLEEHGATSDERPSPKPKPRR